MDANGWVAIDLIASFNRIKKLTSDIAVVVECMHMTPLLEVSPRGKFVRLAQTWPEWTLPNAVKNEEVEKEIEEEKRNPTKKPVAEKEELEEGEIREEKKSDDKEKAPTTPDKEAPEAPSKDEDEETAAPQVPAKEPTPSIRTLSPRDGAFPLPVPSSLPPPS